MTFQQYYSSGEKERCARSFQDAYTSFNAAQQLAVTNYQIFDTEFHLGDIADLIGQPNNALDHYNAAFAIKPAHHEVRFNRGTVRLLTEDFMNGWADYSAYYDTKKYLFRPPPFPFWDGHSHGKGLLLYSDQGNGDAIQFIRYHKDLRQFFSKIYLIAKEDLRRILQAAGPFDQFIPDSQIAAHCPGGSSKGLPCDYFAPLSLLPQLLTPNYRDMNAWQRYITTDPALVAARAGLLPHGNKKVGIAWRGSKTTPRDPVRSFPPHYFSKLAAVPGVHLYSLQMDGTSAEVATIGTPAVITNLALEMAKPNTHSVKWDYMDTAAVIENLDLVVTCDSSVAHVAGSVGKLCWIPLPVASEWRWLLDRSTTRWYENTTLFRQSAYAEPVDDNWDDVFNNITAELAHL